MVIYHGGNVQNRLKQAQVLEGKVPSVTPEDVEGVDPAFRF